MSFNASDHIDSILTALQDAANNSEIQNGQTDSFGHGIVDVFDVVTLLSTKCTQLDGRSDPSAEGHIWLKLPTLLVIISVIAIFML